MEDAEREVQGVIFIFTVNGEKTKERHRRYRAGHVKVEVWLDGETAVKLSRMCVENNKRKSEMVREMIERWNLKEE